MGGYVGVTAGSSGGTPLICAGVVRSEVVVTAGVCVCPAVVVSSLDLLLLTEVRELVLSLSGASSGEGRSSNDEMSTAAAAAGCTASTYVFDFERGIDPMKLPRSGGMD